MYPDVNSELPGSSRLNGTIQRHEVRATKPVRPPPTNARPLGEVPRRSAPVTREDRRDRLADLLLTGPLPKPPERRLQGDSDSRNFRGPDDLRSRNSTSKSTPARTGPQGRRRPRLSRVSDRHTRGTRQTDAARSVHLLFTPPAPPPSLAHSPPANPASPPHPPVRLLITSPTPDPIYPRSPTQPRCTRWDTEVRADR